MTQDDDLKIKCSTSLHLINTSNLFCRFDYVHVE